MTDVAQTYRQHEVLLTGGNGFLGKVILGLLLDRYPDCRRLHLLIRPRRDRTAEQRFEQEILGSPALQGIVQKHGADFIRSKVSVWAGDASEPNCGLDPSQTASWGGKLGLIINSAGLVEFFPPVDDSLRANVQAVENLVSMAKGLGAKLLHVSTCYVAGKTEGLIEETEPIAGFYPKRKDPADRRFDHLAELDYCRERIHEILDAHGAGGERLAKHSRDSIRRLTDLGKQRAEGWGWVNTYTYTKSLGEQVIAAEENLDYAIVRPAIVESALRFPFPGWIEGGRTAAPLVLMALGGMTDWPVRPEISLEIVPVDLVAAAIVLVGALLIEGRHEPVYQLATADRNPFDLGSLIKLLAAEAAAMRSNGPSGNAGDRLPLWLDPVQRVRFLSADQARLRRQRLQHRIDRSQRFVARLQDVAGSSALPGKALLAHWARSLRTLGLQAKFREQTLDQYLPFILDNRYIFEAHNIRQASTQIVAEDRERLPWGPESIDWRQYWRTNQIGGIQKWVQPEAVRDWTFRI